MNHGLYTRQGGLGQLVFGGAGTAAETHYFGKSGSGLSFSAADTLLKLA
jgi:hypothetical protein